MLHTSAVRSRRFWSIAAGFWLLFGLMAGVQVWISMITHGHSVPLLLGYYMLIWLAWLPVTAVVVWLARRWPVIPLTFSNALVHLAAAVLIGLIHILVWIALMLTLRPFDVMTATADSLSVGEVLLSYFPLELILYLVVLGAVQALDYYEKYRSAQSSLNDARLHALELQLQPHFLFNTLNSVSALVRGGKPEEAVKMIAGLSDLLRYTLDRSGAQRVALDEEVQTLRRYLEIQRVRFSDRMSLDIDVAGEVAKVRVPTFILQPLAENAVRHGLSRSASGGRIELRAWRDNGFVKIEMFNTGALDERYRAGVGLKNTVDRLQQIYGGGHEFSLHAARGGVVAAIAIPWSAA